MKTRLLLTVVFCCLLASSAKAIDLVKNDSEKRIDVLINGKLFTSYLYSDKYYKPVLYPINAPNGTVITRGYPIDPRPGERIDHPHHIGMWFNHGNVNGLDFWNNSDVIPQEDKAKYGTIKHKAIVSLKNSTNLEGLDAAELKTESEWVDINNKVLLDEETTLNFVQYEGIWAIVRTTKLTAKDTVVFGETKEGLLGLRFCREFEDVADLPKKLLNDQLVPTDTTITDNSIATGKYRNDQGLEGGNVWGKSSTWVSLTGTKDNTNISMAMIDHPSNIGYPAHNHARGYGLFAINNMGSSMYVKTDPVFEHTLLPGKSVTFKHAFIIRAYSPFHPNDLEFISDFFGTKF